MPKPIGCSMNIRTYVDADISSNSATRRSHTGILVYLKNSLIILVLKAAKYSRIFVFLI